MDKTKWSFSGKNYKIIIEEDGNYTFKGILVASDNPTLKVKKAEIVLKKYNILQVFYKSTFYSNR